VALRQTAAEKAGEVFFFFSLPGKKNRHECSSAETPRLKIDQLHCVIQNNFP